MTRALVTQMLNALEHHQSQTRPIHKTEFAIAEAREYLATEPSSERAELIERLNECLSGPAALTTREATAIKDAADMLEAEANLLTQLARRTVERNMVIGMAVDGIDAQQAKSKDAELIATYAKLAEAELRANQLESQFKSQCRITASALDERAQQAKRVPMTMTEKSATWVAATIEMPSHENCYLRGMIDAEAHHGITDPAEKPTGWDNGLSQDYCKEFGQWLASRPGARQQIKEMFEATDESKDLK